MKSLFLVALFTTLVSGITSQQPVSVSNPFQVNDPVSVQLQTYAQSNPAGSLRRITDGSGNPLPTNTASLAISSRGPLLFDNILLNKLASFNRERIPERVVHARGHGALGHFIVTDDVSRYTKAKVFNGIGKVTPVLVRFSSTFGNAGVSETLPDARGFTVRFYTQDGNLDFPGLQNDAFHVRDAMLFPDFVRTVKRNPATHLQDFTMFYDFLSLRPEVIHNHVKFFSDKESPGSSRAMNGSAINTYECVNAQGVVVYCKFSWRSWQNIAPLTEYEPQPLAGTQPDYYTRDLYDAIGTGNYPKWTFGMQVMTFEEAESLPFNPFDVTKVWRFENFPFIPIGVFVLDRNPTNFFAQIEQAAFCPNFVPGIRASPDRVLQARAFAYRDAQRYRLGVNFDQIEVNRPLSRVDGYERDGAMRISAVANGEGGPVYFPNSFNGPRLDREASTEGTQFFEGFMSRADSGDEDNFSQPREYLERDISREERGRIATRIGTVLALVTSEDVILRVLTICIAPLGREFSELVVTALRARLAETSGISGSYQNTTVVDYKTQTYF